MNYTPTNSRIINSFNFLSLRALKLFIILVLSLFASIALEAGIFTNSGIKHLAVIPDGNRRWAKANDLPISEGHRQCIHRVVPELINFSFEHGLEVLTIWFFSTENWKRSENEVATLMSLFEEFFQQIVSDLIHKHNIRFVHLGRKDRLPCELLRHIYEIEESTKENSGPILNIAIDYSGSDELIRAS